MISASKLSLRGLRTFCVAARHESFSKAAEDLFITPSAVSHQIKSLEEELGKPLFHRTARELELTQTGRALYGEVNPLIEKLDAVAAKFKEGATSRSIRISVQPFFASEYFIPRLSMFTAEHPDIEIQVGSSDESADKHPPDTDLSIRLFGSPPPGMPSNLLFPLRMIPAGSPEFRDAMKVRKKKIVSEFPLLVHETRPNAWLQWASATGIELPKQPKLTRLDSMIAVVRAAQRGIGAALVPVPIADLWFEEGSLVRLFNKELVADDSYYLVCSPDRVDDEHITVFRDWIVENFADPT